jgi:hypothetical protein
MLYLLCSHVPPWHVVGQLYFLEMEKEYTTSVTDTTEEKVFVCVVRRLMQKTFFI